MEKSCPLDDPRPSASEGETPPASFEELWLRHGPSLRRLCTRWMSGRDDLGDEAFSRASLLGWQKYPARQHTIRKPAAWLRRLAYNVCMDLHRELGRQGDQPATDLDGVEAQDSTPWPGAPTDPERQVLRAERWSVIETSLGSLSHNLRVVMVRVFLRGESYREVAQRLDISEPALRKRVEEARRRLRRQVALYREGKKSVVAGPQRKPRRSGVESRTGGARRGIGRRLDLE